MNNKTFADIVNNVFIAGILKPIVPLLIGLAVVLFIYGVLTLILSEGGEKQKEGKDQMIWGIVAIVVIVSIWGLVALLQRAFLGNEGASRAPSNFEQMIPWGKI